MKADTIIKLHKRLAKKSLQRKGFRVLLLTSILFSCGVIITSVYYTEFANGAIKKQVLGATTELLSPTASLTNTPTTSPTPIITPTEIPAKQVSYPTSTIVLQPTPYITGTNQSQYTALQINDVTWKVNDVKNDDAMASSQDIFNALNSYRGAHGKSNLTWDSGLASFAQGRADLFAKNGSLDSHAGFDDFMKNGGFDKVGFNSLGENSAYLSGPMNGEHIIRNIFGADSSHDGNQLDPSWTHVGIGVNGNAVNINFGKNKR